MAVAYGNPYEYSLTTRLKERALLEFLNPQEHERILDLGCGLGYFSKKISDRKSFTYALDIDFPSLAKAREFASALFVQAKAISIPLKANSVDKVLFTDVVEHLPDESLALAEISRVLKKGGRVVISTASKKGILCGTRLSRLFHDIPGTPEYHYCDGYHTEELKQILKECGFDVTGVSYSTVFLGEIFVEIMKLAYSFFKKDFGAQADVLQVNNSLAFLAYRKIVFPIFYLLSEAETRLFSRFFGGHIIIMEAVKHG